MSALTVEQIIKLILGAVVVVAVVIGIYFIAKNKFFDFFKGLSIGNVTKAFMVIIK
jgi:hypothetical protein